MEKTIKVDIPEGYENNEIKAGECGTIRSLITFKSAELRNKFVSYLKIREFAIKAIPLL